MSRRRESVSQKIGSRSVSIWSGGDQKIMKKSPVASPTDIKLSTLRFDVVAGLTAAAVVLPKAMAYATVAGLPVTVGLYTSFVPMIVYALLGTSRVLSVSSTTTLAIL